MKGGFIMMRITNRNDLAFYVRAYKELYEKTQELHYQQVFLILKTFFETYSPLRDLSLYLREYITLSEAHFQIDAAFIKELDKISNSIYIK